MRGPRCVRLFSLSIESSGPNRDLWAINNVGRRHRLCLNVPLAAPSNCRLRGEASRRVYVGLVGIRFVLSGRLTTSRSDLWVSQWCD
jgi:hypothetical protein